MKKLLVVLILLSHMAFGEDPKYPVSAIPEELKEGVNVVLREDHAVFTIHTKSKASYYVHQVHTILNPNGKNYAKEVVPYSKLRKVSTFKGYVYDANGKLISKLKPSDIYDGSAYNDGLFSDVRFKSADLSQGTYPYTVEYEYEIEFKFLFYIPSFYLVGSEKMSAEHSSYTLVFPEELRPRYKTFLIDAKPEEDMKDKMVSVSWKFNNTKPIKTEMFGPSADALVPHIDAAPTQFEYEGYAGTMQTWEDFGKWISLLNAGRKVLPEPTKQKIRQIAANGKTNEEKIKLLYEYLQSKTRYVSIQMGIGGQQPFEALTVDQTGYGDCKALSNYMVAMLDEIGIKSNYTLISAGEDAPKMDVDFPSTQFNHAIVSVPNGQDTLWLECTSQTNPFGYQGTFTGNRKALIITDDGARIVKTTSYKAEDNLQSRIADVKIDATGNAKAVVKTTYAGTQYENGGLHFKLGDLYDEQKEWLHDNIEIPSYNINSFSMVNHKNKIPSADVNVDLTLPRFATVTGKRLFLTPNLMNRSTFIPEKVESRKTNVVWDSPYTDVDTIRYHLPEGIYPEFLPEPVKIKSRFGEYEAKFIMEQDKLIYIRKVKTTEGEYPPDTYQELIDFHRGMNKADNIKIVFLNKT